MRLLRKFMGGLLALILMVTLTPAASARQFYSYLLDGNSAGEIEVMLNGISEQTFTGTSAAAVKSDIEHFLYTSDFSAIGGEKFPYTNSSGYWAGKSVSDGTYTQVVSATGCMAYCKFVAQVIYGSPGERRDLGESAGQITGAGLKSFLDKYAQAGEHVRVDGKHSVTYVSGNESGFYYLDYAGDQNPRIWLRFSTYDNFAARCNELYKKVWIYEASTGENTGEGSRSDEPPKWLADYVRAAGELGLVQGGSTSTYDSPLTQAEAVTLAARAHSLFTEGSAVIDTGSGENWYDPYVDYLMDKRVLKDDLDYADAATRDQFVGLMAAAVPGDMELESINPPADFEDAARISDPLAVDELCQAGILTGISEEDGLYFYPDNVITRGEAIAVMVRLVLPEFRVG